MDIERKLLSAQRRALADIYPPVGRARLGHSENIMVHFMNRESVRRTVYKGDIDMVFPRCPRCGVVAGIACACTLATLHSQSFCGQLDRGGAYCQKATAEQPHDHHGDSRISWVRANIASALSTASVTSSFTGATIPGRPTLHWTVKGG